MKGDIFFAIAALSQLSVFPVFSGAFHSTVLKNYSHLFYCVNKGSLEESKQKFTNSKLCSWRSHEPIIFTVENILCKQNMIGWEHLYRGRRGKGQISFSTNWNKRCVPVYLPLLNLDLN